MFRKLSLALALIIFSLGAWADETSLRKLIEVAYPKMNVESVAKTNHAGLYEVYMGGQIIYTDEKFTFLIAEGRMVDTRSKRDITSDRLADLSKIDFSNLPLDQAIKVVKGNGSKKLGVASTPTLFFADGKRMLGAYPAAEIEKALLVSKK